MAGQEKIVELYERDGVVMRRVRRDLGSGMRVTTSDTVMHPDIEVFLEEQPDARVRGYHPSTDEAHPSPKRFTVSELEDWVEDIDSVDVLLRMRELDDRVTADDVYESRIRRIIGAEPQESGFAEDELDAEWDDDEDEVVVGEDEVVVDEDALSSGGQHTHD